MSGVGSEANVGIRRGERDAAATTPAALAHDVAAALAVVRALSRGERAPATISAL